MTPEKPPIKILPPKHNVSSPISLCVSECLSRVEIGLVFIHGLDGILDDMVKGMKHEMDLLDAL